MIKSRWHSGILVFSVFTIFCGCTGVEKITPSQYSKKTSRTITSLPNLVNGRVQIANWKNHKIRFEEFGHGSEEPIVFIHGWSCDSSFWNFQVNEFSARQRVITIDLPGHGKSDHPSFLKYSIEEFAEAINEVFETASIRKAILVGHSLGGVVVRQFYRKFPDKVLALVIADSDLAPWPKESIDYVRKLAGRLKTSSYKKVIAEEIDGMFAPSTSEFLRNEIKSKMVSTAKHVMSKALLELSEQKLYKSDFIKVPTLVVKVKYPTSKHTDEEFLRSFIQDLSYQEWENIGHFVMMEDPEKFNQAVLKFLLSKKL
ncbi:MAG: hypothetical protein A4S09_16885 [Proteobacteria bacterium SG_bin7]|nr:MAG: hypothetical protein A4S09_16885 [Proteobacteria bacterium SG_bin7]